MLIVLSFIVGAILGASVVYWRSQKTISAQRKQVEQNHRLMEEVEQSHRIRLQDTVETMQRKHQKELQEQRQPLDEQIDALTQQNQQGLNDLAQDHWNTLEAFQTERYLEITNLTKEHQAEIAGLNGEIVTLKQKFRADMQAIQQQFQKKLENEVESARSQFQVVVDKFINDHKLEIEQIEQKHRLEIEQLTAEKQAYQGNAAISLSSLASGLPTGEALAGADNGSIQSSGAQTNLPTVLTDASPVASFEPPPMPEVDEDLPKVKAASATEESDAQPDPFLTTIRMLGRSKRVSAIGQLSKQVHQANPEGREAIAIALGHIIAANPQSPVIHRAIPSLTKLSQDMKPGVRQVAIEALGSIPSAKVVPVVKRALRDPDSKVIKAANQAMESLRPFAKVKQG